MHHTSTANAASPHYPEGGSIGVPLEECPMCPNSEIAFRVPHLVTTCCGVVERRGLEIVGVYRVPGNSAAVSHLTEVVSKKTLVILMQFCELHVTISG